MQPFQLRGGAGGDAEEKPAAEAAGFSSVSPEASAACSRAEALAGPPGAPGASASSDAALAGGAQAPLAPLFPESTMLPAFRETRPQPLQPLLLLAVQRCARDFRSCSQVACAQMKLLAGGDRAREPLGQAADDAYGAAAAADAESRRTASSLIRTALIQYSRHSREILLKLFLLDVGWMLQPRHGVVEQLLQEIAAMEQQKQKLRQDALMSQWQLQQQAPSLLPPPPLIDAAVDVLSTGKYLRLPLLLPLQLLGKSVETTGREAEDAMREVRRRVADALLLRLHFSQIPKDEVYVHMKRNTHVDVSLPHEAFITAVSDLTTLQALVARISVLEENGYGVDAAASASLGLTGSGAAPPLGVNATLLFLLRTRLASASERLQLLESEAEFERWRAQVRETCVRQIEDLEDEKAILSELVQDDVEPASFSAAAASSSKASSGAAVPGEAPSEEQEDISALLQRFAPSSSASPSLSLFPASASSRASVDAFYSLWRTSRRVAACLEMDLLRDQALRLLRVSHAASASAARLSCASTPPRRLLIAHVTYRSLSVKQLAQHGTATPHSLALDSTAGAGSAPAAGDETGGGGNTRESGAQADRVAPGEAAAALEKPRTAQVLESEAPEDDEDLRAWRERDRDSGEGDADESRVFAPLATAAAIVADAEDDARGAQDGVTEGEEDAEKKADDKKKTSVLLHLKILCGFDTACGGLRTRCLRSLLQKNASALAGKSALGPVAPAEEPSDSAAAPTGQGERSETDEAREDPERRAPAPSSLRQEGSPQESDEAASPVSLDFLLSSASWKISARLWPLHPMMQLYEQTLARACGSASSSSPPVGFLSEADAFALSALSAQPCWKAIETWRPDALRLEDWIAAAAESLSLLQLLTLAFHLLHPGEASRPAVRLRATQGEGEGSAEPAPDAAGGLADAARGDDAVVLRCCRAATPDRLELLRDDGSPLQSSPLPSSPLAFSSAAPSSCLLRAFYYGQACEISVDATTGAARLRCPWMPRRLRQLISAAPQRSLRDMLLLLPLVRRAAFLLQLSEQTGGLARDRRFDCRAAPADLGSWAPPSHAVAAVERLLRRDACARRAPSECAEGGGAEGASSAAGGGDAEGGAREAQQQQRRTRNFVPRFDSLVGVLASEAAEALEKLLHLRVYELAPQGTRLTQAARAGAGGAKRRREGGDEEDRERQAEQHASAPGRDDAREGGADAGSASREEDESASAGCGTSIYTSTAFFRVAVDDAEAASPSTSSYVSAAASSFLVASVLFDDDVVGCSYLLFPSSPAPARASAAAAFADSLDFLLAPETAATAAPSSSASLATSAARCAPVAPKQRGLFASVRLLHTPFRLRLRLAPPRVAAEGEARDDPREARAGDELRGAWLPQVSLVQYLHAVHALLRRNAETLRQLGRLSMLLPLALPVTAEAEIAQSSAHATPGVPYSPSEPAWDGREPLPAGGASGAPASLAGDRESGRSGALAFAGECRGSGESHLQGPPPRRCLDLNSLLFASSPPRPSGASSLPAHSDAPGRSAQADRGETGQEAAEETDGDGEAARSLLLECTVHKGLSTDLATPASGKPSLLALLFSTETACPPRQADLAAAAGPDSDASASSSASASLPSFSLLVSAEALAFICPQSVAQRSQVVLPASEFLQSLQGDATARPALDASALSPHASVSSVAGVQQSVEETPGDEAKARHRPLYRLQWRIGVEEEGRRGGEELAEEGVSAESGDEAPVASHLPKRAEVRIACACRVTATEREGENAGVCNSAQRTLPGEDGTHRQENDRDAESRGLELQTCGDSSVLVWAQCVDCRAECTLPPGCDGLLTSQPTRSDAVAPSESSCGEACCFAATVGRCLAAFLRLQVYTHLQRELVFLQRQAYGKALEIRVCFPGALVFRLHTPARRRPDGRHFVQGLLRSDPSSPSATGALKAESCADADACETLRCAIRLASLPHEPSRTGSSPALELQSHAPSPLAGRARLQSSYPPPVLSASSRAPALGVRLAALSALASESSSSLLSFGVEASSPELSWLFARQAEAAARLLPAQLGALLQLLASSSEMLTSYLSLHFALLLSRPVKRGSTLHLHLQRDQQARLKAFRRNALYGALLPLEPCAAEAERGAALATESAGTPPAGARPEASEPGEGASPDGGGAQGKTKAEAVEAETPGDVGASGAEKAAAKAETREDAGKSQLKSQMAFSDFFASPDASIRALADAAAAAGLELTPVYIQSMTPARTSPQGAVAPAAAAGSASSSGSSASFSATSCGTGAARGGALALGAAEGRGVSLAEDLSFASASLPALILRVPGLPPVLLRLDDGCRCCLRLYIVLQETRERRPEAGAASKHASAQGSLPSTPPGTPAGAREALGASGSPQRASAQSGKAAKPEPGGTHAPAKTVKFVDMHAAASVAQLVSMYFEAAKQGQRMAAAAEELRAKIVRHASFDVLLLASFAAALKHFASAACASVRAEPSADALAEGVEREGLGVARGDGSRVKRPREGDDDAAPATEGAAARRGPPLAPSVSSSFLLGSTSPRASDAASRSPCLAAELPPLFSWLGTCFKLSCSSPLLLGGAHSLYATKPVASLFFFPGLLLPQVLLPLLQLCRVFAVYCTAEVAFNSPAALLLSPLPAAAPRSAPASSPSRASSANAVEVASVALSAAASKAPPALPAEAKKEERHHLPGVEREGSLPASPSASAAAQPPKPGGGETGDGAASASLALWISYTDFASRHSRCQVLPNAAVVASTATAAFAASAAAPPHAACAPSLSPFSSFTLSFSREPSAEAAQQEAPCASPSGRGLSAAKREVVAPHAAGEVWSFARLQLFALPWPRETCGLREPRGGLQDAAAEGHKGESDSRVQLRWTPATSEALLTPWGATTRFAEVQRDARTRAEEEIPPLLPRLAVDEEGRTRIVLPFFQLRLCPGSAPQAEASGKQRSLSVLQGFVSYVAPCLPLNNIPTFVAHLLYSLSRRDRQADPPSPSSAAAAASGSSRDALQETGAWFLQPLRSLAVHLAFHAALISLRKERAAKRGDCAGNAASAGDEEAARGSRKDREDPRGASLPSAAPGEDACVIYRIVYVTGYPERAEESDRRKEVEAAPQVEASPGEAAASAAARPPPLRAHGRASAEDAGASRVREEWLYRCLYPSLADSLNADFAFARFAALVAELYDGLAQVAPLYLNEYCRMRAVLSQFFAYLDARDWRVDPRGDPEVRALVGDGVGAQAAPAAATQRSVGEETQGDGARKPAGPRDPTAHGGDVETPHGLPLLVPLPKLPFIECRFLPQHAPDGLHMEFALHRLLPLHHCPFYSVLHFLHLLPPRAELPAFLPPASSPPATQPVLLLQPRVKFAADACCSAGGGPRAAKPAKASQDPAQAEAPPKEETPTRPPDGPPALQGASHAHQPGLALARAFAPFTVYRCFTATLHVQPFPPPHVSHIHIRGIKLPALLQELQRHERLVSTTVLKPQMERASREFHLAISYSLAACAALFFGAVDFDFLARALQKLAAQLQSLEGREAALGKLVKREPHALVSSPAGSVAALASPLSTPAPVLASSQGLSQAAPAHAPAASASLRIGAQGASAPSSSGSPAPGGTGPHAGRVLLQKAASAVHAAPRHMQQPQDSTRGASPGGVAESSRDAAPGGGAQQHVARPSEPRGNVPKQIVGGQTPATGGGGAPERRPATEAAFSGQAPPSQQAPHAARSVGLEHAHGGRGAQTNAGPAQPFVPGARDELSGAQRVGREGLPPASRAEESPQEFGRGLPSPQTVDRGLSAVLGHSGAHPMASAAGRGGHGAVPGLQQPGIVGAPRAGAVGASPQALSVQRHPHHLHHPPLAAARQMAYEGVKAQMQPGPAAAGTGALRRMSAAQMVEAACAVATNPDQEQAPAHPHALHAMQPAAQQQVHQARHPAYAKDSSQVAYPHGVLASQQPAQGEGGLPAMAHAGLHPGSAPASQQMHLALKSSSGTQFAQGHSPPLHVRQAVPGVAQSQPQAAPLGKEGYRLPGERQDLGRLPAYTAGSGGGVRDDATGAARMQPSEAFHGAHEVSAGSHPHQGAAAPHYHPLQHQHSSQQPGRSLAGPSPPHFAQPQVRGGGRQDAVPVAHSQHAMRPGHHSSGDTREALMLQERQRRLQQQQAAHQHALHLQQQGYAVHTQGGAPGGGLPAAGQGSSAAAASRGAGSTHPQHAATACRPRTGDEHLQGTHPLQGVASQVRPAPGATSDVDAQMPPLRAKGPEASAYGAYGNVGQGYPQPGSCNGAATGRFPHQTPPAAGMPVTAHSQQAPPAGMHVQGHPHMQHSQQVEQPGCRQATHDRVAASGPGGFGGVPRTHLPQAAVAMHPTAQTANAQHAFHAQRDMYPPGNRETGTVNYAYQMQQQRHVMLQVPHQSSSQPAHAHHGPHQQPHPAYGQGGGQGWH
ncbi:hypothetical protein BESB_083370 [Besnoitia besnoiti]|uniref:Uncharacterized protein n=1 Tax=Besnoitia besnoiti TaxID=94643 RepID=A0A2A9M3S6_BESBE|nr:hypothetical protein BESB_083370 [Besnoitia besnoiti]PFH33138.1 hypothetical protein BESB_083370 [Besnoitia besnoiti]